MRFGAVDRFVLLGGGPLLAGFASQLIGAGRRVEVVTSQRHLGEPVTESRHPTLEEYLSHSKVEFTVSANVNTDAGVTGKITPQTLGVSIGAAWIFNPDFIGRFQGRLVNVHGTRLPQDRGGGGFSWRIMRDDRLGFSTIHQIDPGVDTGDIVAYDEYFFPHSCRVPADFRRHSLDKNLALLDRFTSDVVAEQGFRTLSQTEYLSTYWPRLSTDVHGFIDWSWSLRDIERFICAFDAPYPGAITFVNDARVRLRKCLSTTSDGMFHPFQKGIVYKITGGALFIAAESGSLIVSSVTDDDGVSVLEKLSVGDRLYTPGRQLEDARRYRAVYTPAGLRE